MINMTSIAILAGGESSRMGRDKSFVELGGKPLITRVIALVSQLTLPIHIIANRPEAYQVFGLPVFTDVLADRSSLGGLYSAIYHSQTEYTLCVACDMPFLNPTLLNHLISMSTDYDATVPMIGEHPQGLHAIYRKTCLTPMLRELEHNRLKIRDFYALVNTRWIDEATLRQCDAELKSFVNVNTPEALDSINSVSN